MDLVIRIKLAIESLKTLYLQTAFQYSCSYNI